MRNFGVPNTFLQKQQKPGQRNPSRKDVMGTAVVSMRPGKKMDHQGGLGTLRFDVDFANVFVQHVVYFKRLFKLFFNGVLIYCRRWVIVF